MHAHRVPAPASKRNLKAQVRLTLQMNTALLLLHTLAAQVNAPTGSITAIGNTCRAFGGGKAGILFPLSSGFNER